MCVLAKTNIGKKRQKKSHPKMAFYKYYELTLILLSLCLQLLVIILLSVRLGQIRR